MWHSAVWCRGYNGPEESVFTMQICTVSYSESQQFQKACWSSSRDLSVLISPAKQGQQNYIENTTGMWRTAGLQAVWSRWLVQREGSGAEVGEVQMTFKISEGSHIPKKYKCTLTFRRPCIVIDSYNKSQRDALFLKFILVKNCTCFGQIYCPSSGVLTLYTQQ